MEGIKIMAAPTSHERFINTLLQPVAEVTKVRGTGIAKRTHEYLTTKIRKIKVATAPHEDTSAEGSYTATWDNKHHVITFGLIVHASEESQHDSFLLFPFKKKDTARRFTLWYLIQKESIFCNFLHVYYV